MRDLADVTLGEIRRGLSRYRPVIGLALVLLLGIAVLRQPPVVVEEEVAPESSGLLRDQEGPPPSQGGDAPGGEEPGPAAEQGGEEAPVPREEGADAQAAAEPPAAVGGQVGPECDPETGRIKVPDFDAAPCVDPFRGDNGGSTYRGVESDVIRVVLYQGEIDPVAEAALAGAQVLDSEEAVRETYLDYAEYFEFYYETHGREVEIIPFSASGSDEQAQRADALRVANEIDAFASIDSVLAGSGSVYWETLAREGVLCLCSLQDSRVVPEYLDHSPFWWGYQLGPEFTYLNSAEYIGKNLWGQTAEHAGDITLRTADRRLGLLYAETRDQTNEQAADFLERELGERGAGLATRVAFTAGNVRQAQEQARSVIAQLRESDVTTVLYKGGPLILAVFTKEATQQQYFPEWFLTGGSSVDTNLLGRSYDEAQARNMFGLGTFWVEAQREQQREWRLHHWFHGEGPQAGQLYRSIFPVQWTLFTGIHLAGPTLTPETFRDGLFAYPPSTGGITRPQISFGQGAYPWESYLAYDNQAPIWWDADAVGSDEGGRQGRGMWRWVDGGRRYAPGQWPSGDPRLFDPEGAVTRYEEPPPEDRHPTYEPRH